METSYIHRDWVRHETLDDRIFALEIFTDGLEEICCLGWIA